MDIGSTKYRKVCTKFYNVFFHHLFIGNKAALRMAAASFCCGNEVRATKDRANSLTQELKRATQEPVLALAERPKTIGCSRNV